MENLKHEEQERLQQIVTQIRESQALAEALQQNISFLTGSLAEMSATIESIKRVKDLKSGSEILVPIGSDSFINAKLARPDRVLTGLGAEVVAERSAEDAVKLLESQLAELEKAVGQAHEEFGRVCERIETLRPEAERIIQRAKSPEG